MADLDAVAVSQLALRTGVATSEQVEEAFAELGKRGGPPEPFLQVLERKSYLTPWQTQKLLKQEVDGYFLGGYKILYKIATGTFGRVYRAEDPRTGTIVAIKVL